MEKKCFPEEIFFLSFCKGLLLTLLTEKRIFCSYFSSIGMRYVPFFVYLCILNKTKNTLVMELNITNENFDEILKNNPVVMVDFGATWCGPCKQLAPVVDEIAKEYDGRVAVGKADVEECTDITSRFRIRNVPTVLFFKNGELKDKSVGAVPKNSLTDKLNALL